MKQKEHTDNENVVNVKDTVKLKIHLPFSDDIDCNRSLNPVHPGTYGKVVGINGWTFLIKWNKTRTNKTARYSCLRAYMIEVVT